MRDIDNTPTEKASGDGSCTGLAAWSFGQQELSAIEGLNASRTNQSESWLPSVAFMDLGTLMGRRDDTEERGMGYIPEEDDDIENRGMGYIPEEDDDIENRGMGYIPEEDDDIENRGMGYLQDAVNQVWDSIADDGSIVRVDAQGRPLARTNLTDSGSIITEFDPASGEVVRSTETRLGFSGEHIVTLRNSAGHTVLESQITGDENESRVVTTSYGPDGKPIFLSRQSPSGNAYLVLDSNTGTIIQSGAVDKTGNWQYENDWQYERVGT